MTLQVEGRWLGKEDLHLLHKHIGTSDAEELEEVEESGRS